MCMHFSAATVNSWSIEPTESNNKTKKETEKVACTCRYNCKQHTMLWHLPLDEHRRQWSRVCWCGELAQTLWTVDPRTSGHPSHCQTQSHHYHSGNKSHHLHPDNKPHHLHSGNKSHHLYFGNNHFIFILATNHVIFTLATDSLWQQIMSSPLWQQITATYILASNHSNIHPGNKSCHLCHLHSGNRLTLATNHIIFTLATNHSNIHSGNKSHHLHSGNKSRHLHSGNKSHHLHSGNKSQQHSLWQQIMSSMSSSLWQQINSGHKSHHLHSGNKSQQHSLWQQIMSSMSSSLWQQINSGHKSHHLHSGNKSQQHSLWQQITSSSLWQQITATLTLATNHIIFTLATNHSDIHSCSRARTVKKTAFTNESNSLFFKQYKTWNNQTLNIQIKVFACIFQLAALRSYLALIIFPSLPLWRWTLITTLLCSRNVITRLHKNKAKPTNISLIHSINAKMPHADEHQATSTIFL